MNTALNILLINHYAGSMEHGMEFRPYYLASRWVKMGHNVTIVASSFSHLRTQNPNMEGAAYKEEMIDGIRYVWLKGNSYSKNNLGRICNMLSFLKKLYCNVGRVVGEHRPDVVIASSTYPLDIYPAHKIATIYEAKLVYELHDLWPLSPILLGNMSPRHPYIRVIQKAENDCYRFCDRVVSLLPNAKQHCIEHGMAPEHFVYIPNGVVHDDWEREISDPVPYVEQLETYKREGWFLVGYTGAHGIANNLDSFIDAALELRDLPIKLVLIGNGLERERLCEKVIRLGLSNVVEMFPAVDKCFVAPLLNLFDVAFISLQKKPLFMYGVSPNKLMEYMLAARPVIFAIEAGNDPVKEAGCGLSVPSSDSQGIAQAIKTMFAMPATELEAMGKRGYTYILENHEYDTLATRFIDALSDEHSSQASYKPTIVISPCILAYNEQASLPKILNNMLEQDYPHELIELLLIDSMSTDATRSIMEEFAKAHADEFYSVRVLENVGRRQAPGWNTGIREYRGDALLCIAAHATITPDFLSGICARLASGEKVCGGRTVSVMEEHGPLKDALQTVESSIFGSSFASFRRSDVARYVDSLNPAAYSREVLDTVGGFNEQLGRTEDNEFHYRIRTAGYRFFFDPTIKAYQAVRPTFMRLMKQKYSNGYWIGLTLGVCPQCLSPYHMVPALFVCAIIATSILATVGYPLCAIALWSIYALAAIIMSIVGTLRAPNRHLSFLLLPALFFLLHLSYGIGTLVGLIKMPFLRGKLRGKRD